MNLICIDFDDTFTQEAFREKVKKIIADAKSSGCTDIKVGIVTARSIFDDFQNIPMQFLNDIETILIKEDIRLDFIASTYELFIPDNTRNTVAESFTHGESLPISGLTQSNGYMAYRRENTTEIQFIANNAFEHNTQSANQKLTALRTKIAEKLKLDGELNNQYKAKKATKDASSQFITIGNKRDSYKSLQIHSIAQHFSTKENTPLSEVKILHIDDDINHHVAAINRCEAGKNTYRHWEAIAFHLDHLNDIISKILNFIGLGNKLKNKEKTNSPTISPSVAFATAESAAGKFSVTYKCFDSTTNELKSAQMGGIPLEEKPATKFLTALGCKIDESQPLTVCSNVTTKYNDVTISGLFNPKTTLTISGERIDELRNSATLYVNSATITAAEFKSSRGVVGAQEKERSKNGIAWQNLATGICHAQKIDLLVKQRKTADDTAVASAKEGRIEAGDPGIWLLSTPALNFGYGLASELKNPESYIKNMYHVIFLAAAKKNCQYITMPAAGLGVFGGDPNLYFECFFEVAKLYPQLNIFYHPGAPKNHSTFDNHLKQYAGKNVFHATKDVVYLADELAKQGLNCALHNPSDADVVYGVFDIGEYWKNGLGDGYVGEEHLGSMTTAVLNSAGLNPDVYNNPCELTPNILESKKKQTNAQPSQSSSALFNKSKTAEEILFENIQNLIDTLKKEIQSCWPYPNKDRKAIKVAALTLLMSCPRTNPALAKKIIEIEERYPEAFSGTISNRTFDAINDIKTHYKIEDSKPKPIVGA